MVLVNFFPFNIFFLFDSSSLISCDNMWPSIAICMIYGPYWEEKTEEDKVACKRSVSSYFSIHFL